MANQGVWLFRGENEYAPSPKIYKIFYDFSVYLLEIFELNIIIISPLGNLLAVITLPISRYSLIEEIKK